MKKKVMREFLQLESRKRWAWSSFPKLYPTIYQQICYSLVQNKRPPRLLIFEFFSNLNAYLEVPLFIIPNIFLVTCTEIDDLDTYIPISKFQ